MTVPHPTTRDARSRPAPVSVRGNPAGPGGGPAAFQSVSIVLPAINETVSLQQTVQLILESSGALREAFDLATGSHVVMMASDLETDPRDVPVLIAEARRNPGAIITASRWREGGGFQGYSPVKLVANRIFQKFFSLLYATHLSDMTYGYRLLPTWVVQSVRWEELRHSFFFETLVKPLRLGIPVVEIPSHWKARSEGESQNTFFRNFQYFQTGLKARFCSRSSLLRPGITAFG